MAISISLTGTLAFTESSETLYSKTIAETAYTAGDELVFQRRVRIANGATETVTLPTTTGKFLYANITSGGPLTFRFGASLAVPLSNFVFIQGDFTVLTFTNASGAACDLEFAIVCED